MQCKPTDAILFLHHRKSIYEEKRRNAQLEYDRAKQQYESGWYYRIFKTPFDQTYTGSSWIFFNGSLDNIEYDIKRAEYALINNQETVNFDWGRWESYASDQTFLDWYMSHRTDARVVVLHAGMPSFEDEWNVKRSEGYMYGPGALEHVQFGFKLALDAIQRDNRNDAK